MTIYQPLRRLYSRRRRHSSEFVFDVDFDRVEMSGGLPLQTHAESVYQVYRVGSPNWERHALNWTLSAIGALEYRFLHCR